MILRAPFPWFGGKSRAASLVWQAFGDVANYVEPFAGSLAVLLARPTPPRVETVNDKDCYLANFWRAVHADPEGVAHHADWPVNEADLHARHRWLVEQASFRERMRREPDFFDAKVAGWWVWGISQWIGSGWCAQPAWEEQDAAGAKRTCGIHTAEYEKRPALDKPGRGVHQIAARGESLANAVNWEGRTNAGRAPRGVHARQVAQDERLRMLRSIVGLERRPHLSSANGIHTAVSSTWQQMPDISGSRGASGRGVVASGSRGTILEWMQALANGGNPKLRIALCGYEGEHDMPANWRCVTWKAPGGYAASAGNTANAQRERIWFSPYCMGERQPDLFSFAEAT